MYSHLNPIDMQKPRDKPALVIRRAIENDEPARHGIVQLATRELRETYRPAPSPGQAINQRGEILVALLGDMLVGTAEYITRDDHVHVQGIAVHPEFRSMGIARALLGRIEEIAINIGLPVLSLSTIEETGNARLFERLGFTITNRIIAPDYVSPDGRPVTQLEMARSLVQPASDDETLDR